MESAGDRVTWTYDAANQLSSEHRTGVSGFRHTFAYDPAGNRTLKNEDSDRTTFAYDPANRLQRSAALSGLTTYIYDAAGNQRTVEEPTGDVVTNTWSYENQNTLVEQPIGDRVTLTYNGDKMRVAREDADESRRFEWDKQNLLLETDDLGTPLARNTHEPDEYGRLVSREDLTTSEPVWTGWTQSRRVGQRNRQQSAIVAVGLFRSARPSPRFGPRPREGFPASSGDRSPASCVVC